MFRHFLVAGDVQVLLHGITTTSGKNLSNVNEYVNFLMQNRQFLNIMENGREIAYPITDLLISNPDLFEKAKVFLKIDSKVDMNMKLQRLQNLTVTAKEGVNATSLQRNIQKYTSLIKGLSYENAQAEKDLVESFGALVAMQKTKKTTALTEFKNSVANALQKPFPHDMSNYTMLAQLVELISDTEKKKSGENLLKEYEANPNLKQAMLSRGCVKCGKVLAWWNSIELTDIDVEKAKNWKQWAKGNIPLVATYAAGAASAAAISYFSG